MDIKSLEIQEEKLQRLEDILRDYGSAAVAFSGGVDSTFLLAVAHNVLGDHCLAVTADSPSFPRREHDGAAEFCRERGIRQIFFQSDELDNEDYVKNPKNRCYYCKHSLFDRMKQIAAEHGLQEVAEGSNVDDLGDYRPGLQAIGELGIRSPLREAGFTKEEIRACSKEMALPTWDKPSFACLASRVPYGESVTEEKLSMVERAENVLSDMGLTQYRVRLHGRLFKESRPMARIEMLPDEFAVIMQKENRKRVVEEFKKAGFSNVTLDLEGYRMGSMNQGLTNGR